MPCNRNTIVILRRFILSILVLCLDHCREVQFASFLSCGFITDIVVNPPERKLAKRTSVSSRNREMNKKMQTIRYKSALVFISTAATLDNTRNQALRAWF